MTLPNEEFTEALGGAKAGHLSESGYWSCADCPENGQEPDKHRAALALYKHRQSARHWEDA